MLDIYVKDDDTTTLRILPVCNCGYVFIDGVICSMKYHKEDDILYPTYSIEPIFCPNCKKAIKCIMYDKDKIEFIKEGF